VVKAEIIKRGERGTHVPLVQTAWEVRIHEARGETTLISEGRVMNRPLEWREELL